MHACIHSPHLCSKACTNLSAHARKKLPLWQSCVCACIESARLSRKMYFPLGHLLSLFMGYMLPRPSTISQSWLFTFGTCHEYFYYFFLKSTHLKKINLVCIATKGTPLSAIHREDFYKNNYNWNKIMLLDLADPVACGRLGSWGPFPLGPAPCFLKREMAFRPSPEGHWPTGRRLEGDGFFAIIFKEGSVTSGHPLKSSGAPTLLFVLRWIF